MGLFSLLLTPLCPAGQRGVLASVLLLLGHAVVTPAFAGDTASLDVLGYSPDGKVFAFEEYGIQDGSGFPYSNVYFIDTDEDKFLPGTPIKVRLEEEAPLAEIRDMARRKAEPLKAKYRLDDNPGTMIVYNPPSEIGADPHKVRFHPYLSAPIADDSSTLELTEREFPMPETCAGFADSNKGFTLRLSEYQGNPNDRVIHADSAIPASRGCPNEYRIGAVISSEFRQVPLIAMILVGSFGFEGNDRRWIAVPVKPYGP